jgi:hypothetical protein
MSSSLVLSGAWLVSAGYEKLGAALLVVCALLLVGHGAAEIRLTLRGWRKER